MSTLPEDLQTIDASELGKILGRGTKTIKMDALRKPESLPPRLRIPGSSKLVWRVVDVREWLQALADEETDRRAAAVKAAKRAGTKTDFGFKPIALANANVGTRASKRLALNKADGEQK